MKILNPLDSITEQDDLPLGKSESSDKSDLQSESLSLENETYKQCPKCNGPMGEAAIYGGEEINWCRGCRVTTPVKE